MPNDEAPPSFDADAIRRYVLHAPGVGAVPRRRPRKRPRGDHRPAGRAPGGDRRPLAPRRIRRGGAPRRRRARAVPGHPEGDRQAPPRGVRRPPALGPRPRPPLLHLRGRRGQRRQHARDARPAGPGDVDRPRGRGLLRSRIRPAPRQGGARPRGAGPPRVPRVGASTPGHPYGRTVAASDLASASRPATPPAGWRGRPSPATRWCSRSSARSILPLEVERIARDTFGRWSSADPACRRRSLSAGAAGAGAEARRHRHAPARRHPGAERSTSAASCRPPPSSPARYDVMARILGERLTDVLRRSFGASYGFSAGATIHRGGAVDLALGGAVDNEHVADVRSTVVPAILHPPGARALEARGRSRPRAGAPRAPTACATRPTARSSVRSSPCGTRTATSAPLDAYPEDLLGDHPRGPPGRLRPLPGRARDLPRRRRAHPPRRARPGLAVSAAGLC